MATQGALEEPRVPLRKRLERPLFALNGIIFLAAAMEGNSNLSRAPEAIIGFSVVCGVMQILAFFLSAKKLPLRLLDGLTAVGMLANMFGAVDHRSGVQFLYGALGLIWVVVMIFGRERVAQMLRSSSR